MKKVMYSAMFVAALATLALIPAEAGGSNKVQVCHIPPGNPDNFHTISVSEKALPAHLGHGDLPGSCSSVGIPCDTHSQCASEDQCVIGQCDPVTHTCKNINIC